MVLGITYIITYSMENDMLTSKILNKIVIEIFIYFVVDVTPINIVRLFL